MLKYLRYLFVIILALVSSVSGMAFYDSDSWCYYNILSNSDESGYTVELTSSDLLDVVVPSTVIFSGKTYTVVGIATGAFKNKTLNIDKFKLPNTLEYIGEQAFYNTKFQTPNKTKTYSLSLPSGIISIGKEAFMNAYSHNDGRIAIYLPDSLNEIAYRCFFQADFQSVQVNKTCSSIRGMAFNAFTGSITIPVDNSIINIEGSPFYNSQLTTITLPHIESIETCSFSNCPVLTSISIGDRISVVPQRFLSNCSYLSEVEFEGNLVEIGSNAFQGCSKLKTFRFGNMLQIIGDYAFDGCQQIEYFEFSDCLKNIGNYSFRGCKKFTELYFPDNLESIGVGAFSSIETRRILLNSTIKSIGSNSFSFTGGAEWLLKFAKPTEVLNSLLPFPDGVQLYIPNMCLQDYQYATGWSWQDLEEKDGEYKVLPTWSLTNYSSKYGETVEPQLTYYPCEYLTGEEPISTPVIVSDYNKWKNAGTYPVELSWNNQEHSKFIFLLERNWIISKAELTSKAGNAKRAYGEPNPQVDITYSGFMYGEDESVIEKSPTVTVDATEETSVGNYAINLSGGEAQNYYFKYLSGELTIEKASQMINWNQDFDDIFMGNEIELTATSTSGLSVSYTSSDPGIAEIEGNIVKFISSGEVSITASQNGNDNYHAAESITKTFVVNLPLDNELSLNVSEVGLKPEETIQLIIEDYEWVSSDEKIATVSESGLVTAIAAGEVMITLSRRSDGASLATCKIKVDFVSSTSELSIKKGIEIDCNGNEVRIKGASESSTAWIYDMNGQTVYSGLNRTIHLESGIYIVSIEGSQLKVIIK